MARCNSCNKFVSLDSESDPDSVEVSIDGANVTVTCTIANNCGDCSQEMFTAELEAEASNDDVQEHIDAHERRAAWFTKDEPGGDGVAPADVCRYCGVAAGGEEAHDKQKHAELDKGFVEAEFMATPDEAEYELEVSEGGSSRVDRFEGKGRGARHYYGAEVEYEVTCNVCPDFKAEGSITAEVQASSMDEAQ